MKDLEKIRKDMGSIFIWMKHDFQKRNGKDAGHTDAAAFFSLHVRKDKFLKIALDIGRFKCYLNV